MEQSRKAAVIEPPGPNVIVNNNISVMLPIFFSLKLNLWILTLTSPLSSPWASVVGSYNSSTPLKVPIALWKGFNKIQTITWKVNNQVFY